MRAGVAGVLDAALRDRPDAEAVMASSGSLTYQQLDEAADFAAAALVGLGVRAGDRVLASLPNDLDVVLAFHGAMRIGAIWVGIGEALAASEKQVLVRDCLPRVVLAAPEILEEVEPARKDAVFTPVSVGPLTGDWADRLAAKGAPPVVEVDPHAPAGIAYTSGTTGVPKGIVHSQHNLLLPGEVLVASRGWGPELRKGDCLPLTILNLLVLTTLTTAQAQGCCVIMDRRDAGGIAEWIARGAVTHWNGVPAQLHDLVTRSRVDRSMLATLEEVWSGGGDCPPALRDAFAAEYGISIRTTYGLTEAPTVVSIDPVGDERHGGASGQVLPHLDVRALASDGTVLEPGAVGELRIRAAADGPWAGQWTPYLGVWRNGHVESAPGDSVATGDVGSVDDRGWLRVLDRLKVLIIRGGANVYPAEVERLLMAQAGVAGAVVFGIDDERLGERVAALVELQRGASVTIDDLRTVCDNELAGYKVPETWGIVESLPRNAMGKVVRTGLGEVLEQLKGAPDGSG